MFFCVLIMPFYQGLHPRVHSFMDFLIVLAFALFFIFISSWWCFPIVLASCLLVCWPPPFGVKHVSTRPPHPLSYLIAVERNPATGTGFRPRGAYNRARNLNLKGGVTLHLLLNKRGGEGV